MATRYTRFSGPDIKRADIEFIRKIGGGKYGYVWEAFVFGHLVAVKHLKERTPEKLQLFRKEIELMSKDPHPNICMVLGVCDEGNQVYLVTELAKTSLESMIFSPDYSLKSYFDRLEILIQICKGMIWMHRSDITHCDLKPDNVLLGRDNLYKVTDFGFAQGLKTEFERIGGSALYMSPQRLKDINVVTKETDVYSFAICAWEIIKGMEPFEHHSDPRVFVKAVYYDDERPSPPVSDDDLQTLLESAWHHEPNQRPSFEEILVKLKEIKINEAIHDLQGRQFWKKNFNDGPEVLEEVSWEKFETAFCGETKCGKDSEEMKKLKELLCGYLIKKDIVSILRFGSICDTFSIMKPEGLKVLKSVMGKRWFYSFITEEESNFLLQSHMPGTFLVRFSSSGHHFVISRVIGTEDGCYRKVIHVRVDKSPDGLLHLPRDPNANDQKMYQNIEELVKKENNKLKVACPRFNGKRKKAIESLYTHYWKWSEDTNNSHVFDICSILSRLSAEENPKDILEALKNEQEYLLKQISERENVSDDFTFWLGQTAKYIDLLEDYINGVDPGSHLIQDLIDSKIDAATLT